MMDNKTAIDNPTNPYSIPKNAMNPNIETINYIRTRFSEKLI